MLSFFPAMGHVASDRRRGGSILGWEVAQFAEVLVVGDGFEAVAGGHDLEGDAVGEAQSSFPDLAGAGHAEAVEGFIDPHDLAKGKQGGEPVFHGAPAEACLDEGPGFVDHIARSEEPPALVTGPEKKGAGLVVERVGAVEERVEAARVHKHGLHRIESAQAWSCGLRSSVDCGPYLPARLSSVWRG